MDKQCDIVIAGCGTAGAAAALTAAKGGLKVCIIEQKEPAKIGRKVCGDAIHSEHLEFAKKLGVDFGEKELLNKITGMYLIAPNKKDSIYVEDEGWCIDRHAFGQKLFKEVAAHANIVNANAVAPIIEGNRVIGVATSRGKIFGNVTIDATGVACALRKQINFPTDFPKEMNADDFAKAYRGIVETKDSFDTPHAIKIEFNNEISPGGYLWYFPKSNNVLNIGVGFKGNASVKEVYDKFVRTQFDIRRVIDESAWVLPLRRPLDGFVANGFMIAGDAASQVNPLDGAGIGYSMRGGALAAEAASTGSSRESLWQYNHRFQTELGIKHAQSAVIASALSSLSNDELNFIFKNKIITADDIKRTYTGKSGLDISVLLKKLILGISKPRLISKLYKMVKASKVVKEHWCEYPAKPECLPEWSARSNKIFEEIKMIV